MESNQSSGEIKNHSFRNGCLGLALFFFITPMILVNFGGWTWWNIVRLAILFFAVRWITSRKALGWRHAHSMGASILVTALVGVTYLGLHALHVIEKPLSFDHDIPQRNDLKVMREVFQLSQLPPSFKIAKVRWRGEDWFPSQGARRSQYKIELSARDMPQLFTNTLNLMKPAKLDLAAFYFMMDRTLWDSIMDDHYQHGGKHQWKQFEIETKEETKTIWPSSDLGWDEKTSPTLSLYLRVFPKSF